MSPGRMSITAILAVFTCTIAAESIYAQTAVERNTNAQGVTPAGEYRGIPGMQDNEPSCGINPILPRNIVCAWNASGGSDDLIGDTWVKLSESNDAGETFLNRYMNGSALDPAASIGQQFAADPITLCWPGGCGVVALASTRAPGGGAGGGIYMQVMPDMNTESGFRHALSNTLKPIYLSESTMFADKPFALYMLDEQNPGTVPVTVTVKSPGGGTEVITRDWPKARLLVAFALGDPAGDEIRILSTYSDNYGGTWSTPVELSKRPYDGHGKGGGGHDDHGNGKGNGHGNKSSGLNQGINFSAIGNTVLYTFRTFADDDNPSAIKGAVSTDRGHKIGEPFDIVSPFCAYDIPTLPNTSNTSTAAARTNAFPWISNNGNKFVLVYAERQPSSDGGCFTTFDAPTDSRIKAMVGSASGDSWSSPVEIAPNTDHGFQFQPVVDCSLGVCQAAWWDSRFDSERVTNYLQSVSTSPLRMDALTAFLNFPILGDFNYATGPATVIQFRRTARVLATKLEIDTGTPVATDTPPAIVSQYRKALIDGTVREVERDGWNIKAYKTSSVPFMGDYSWLTSAKWRLVFDPTLPDAVPRWTDNASVDLLNPDRDPLFWISFVTSRNVKGDIYTARMTDPLPYARTPDAVSAMAIEPESLDPAPLADSGETRTANAVEDFNPAVGFCAPTGNPGPGVVFDSPNNRTKDFDIYGALIENEVSAFSLNPTKTLNIQRSYTIVAENESNDAKSFRLVIANQPTGFPSEARASWDQLPFDPTNPDFATAPPVTVETMDVGPKSSESTAAFLVSTAAVNPVAIDIYEQMSGGSERLVNTITINGVAEDGEFLNPDGTANDFEVHNPHVFFPDEFNPDEYNPDEYNPDEFNPDVYTPDEYNPDEFNPDEFNPDEFNPDEFNPDEFNPDEFNPDEFNPDEFNPDEFNAPLIDPGRLDNPEIPTPDTGSISGPVSKLDINYGIQNIGNTTTPYTVDFAVTDPEILALLESGELVTQLIAWQDKKIDDVQFCAPREISENRIIAVANNPDLTVLRVPDINNNRVGALTLTIAPRDVVQLTLRFIAPKETLVPIAGQLSSTKISSVFASLVANTGETSLFPDETLILDDRTPPEFNFVTGDTTTFEADGPLGRLIPTNLVTASRGADTVPVTCDPALPAQVGLDILNTPAGPTEINCTAISDNDVSNELQLFVSVLDLSAPSFDVSSIPVGVSAEAGASGAAVTYTLPTASDANGVDPSVDVICAPSSGSVFPFTAPGPTTTAVNCTATDDSFFSATASFDVSIADTTAPEFVGGPLPDISLEATSPSGAIASFAVMATDIADSAPAVSCVPASGSVFSQGTTGVACTTTDASGNSTSDSFDVNVADATPPLITLIGAATVTIEAGTTYVDPGAIVVDAGDPGPILTIDTSGVDSSTVGTYSVFFDAIDGAGNPALRRIRTVVVEDTTAPGIEDFDPPEFDPPFVDRFVLGDDEGSFQLYWGPFEITDADSAPNVECDVGMLDSGRSDLANGLYTFVHNFPVGTTVVTCTATDDQGNSTMASFPVEIFDETAPVLTLIGDAEITIDGQEPYVDPGATAVDNADGDISTTIAIDASDVDIEESGTYAVIITAIDSSGNSAELTRTVVVERDLYASGWGIYPTRTSTRVGNTVYLFWVWKDENGHKVNSSHDPHSIRIENCSTGEVVREAWGLPTQDNLYYWYWYNKWKYVWRTKGFEKGEYCVTATSSLSGQELTSPPIRLR